jgi:hypothetical protein
MLATTQSLRGNQNGSREILRAGAHVFVSRRLSTNQVNGTEAILAEWKAKSFDSRWLAHMLATTFHETDNTMCAISENLNR